MFQMALRFAKLKKGEYSRVIIGLRKSENAEEKTKMNMQPLPRWSIGDLLRNLCWDVSNSEAALKGLALL